MRIIKLAWMVEEKGHDSGVYTTTAGFAQAMGQPAQVHQLRIATDRHDEQVRQAVAGTAERTLTDAGIEVRSAASISRSEAISEGHLGPVILILLGVALPWAWST